MMKHESIIIDENGKPDKQVVEAGKTYWFGAVQKVK
jgi:hypothetical protein